MLNNYDLKSYVGKTVYAYSDKDEKIIPIEVSDFNSTGYLIFYNKGQDQSTMRIYHSKVCLNKPIKMGVFVILDESIGYVKSEVTEIRNGNPVYVLDIDGKEICFNGESKKLIELYTDHIKGFSMGEKRIIVKDWYGNLKFIQRHRPMYNSLYVEGKPYVSLTDSKPMYADKIVEKPNTPTKIQVPKGEINLENVPKTMIKSMGELRGESDVEKEINNFVSDSKENLDHLKKFEFHYSDKESDLYYIENKPMIMYEPYMPLFTIPKPTHTNPDSYVNPEYYLDNSKTVPMFKITSKLKKTVLNEVNVIKNLIQELPKIKQINITREDPEYDTDPIINFFKTPDLIKDYQLKLGDKVRYKKPLDFKCFSRVSPSESVFLSRDSVLQIVEFIYSEDEIYIRCSYKGRKLPIHFKASDFELVEIFHYSYGAKEQYMNQEYEDIEGIILKSL